MQAFCRLFRIGQVKNVEVVKLVVKDTVEDCILDMQVRKTAEIDKTIGDDALSNRYVLLLTLSTHLAFYTLLSSSLSSGAPCASQQLTQSKTIHTGPRSPSYSTCSARWRKTRLVDLRSSQMIRTTSRIGRGRESIDSKCASSFFGGTFISLLFNLPAPLFEF